MQNWGEAKERLQEMRQEVEERLSATGEYGLNDPLRDELTELSVVDNHPADIASEVFERGKDLALRDLDHLQLQHIDRAIAAIDDGTYGVCQMCGKDIPLERLDANPAAVLCTSCKAADERMHPDRARPVEEEFLYPGFGRTDTDDTEAVAFDGEDSWQAVERFNERADYENDYERIELNDNEGIVTEVDRVTNEMYRDQLP